MDEISSLVLAVRSDQVDTATAALRRLEEMARRSETSTRKLGAVDFRAVIGRLAALGVGVGAIGFAVKKATGEWLKFDKAMKEVQSISGGTREEIVAMRREVLDLATALGVDATQSAKGLYQTISAGIPKGNALEFLAVASKAAVAGVATVESSVDALTAVINAYGMSASDAEKISDKLFLVVKDGITTFPELAENLSKATGPADALGVSLDELLAQVIAITNKKVPTAEAFTQIKASIQALNDPSEQMAEALDAMGFSSSRAAVAALGYSEVLNRVRKYYDGNDAALVKALRSSEAYNGVLATTGRNANKTAGALSDLEVASGNMADAYAINSNTLENALTSLKNAATGLIETMEGSFGIISQFTSLLKDAALAINEIGSFEFFGSGSGVKNALSAKGAVGANLMLEQMEKLRKEQEMLVQAGADANSKGSFLDYVTAGGANDARLRTLNAELGKLERTFDGLSKNDQDLGNISREAKAMEQALATATDPAEVDEYRARLSGLQDDFRSVIDLVNATKQVELESAEAAKAADVAEKEANQKKIADSKVLLAAEKERKATLTETGKFATDLATTEIEKLQKKQQLIRDGMAATEANLRIDEQVGNKALANLDEQIKLIEERDAKAAAGGGGGGGGGGGAATATRSLSAAIDSLPEISDPFGTDNLFDELRKQEEEIVKSYEKRREAIITSTELTENQRQKLLADSSAQYQALMQKADEKRFENSIATLSSFLGDGQKIAAAFGKKGAGLAKGFAVAQATVDMFAASLAAYKATVGIPVVGPYLAPAAAAGALAVGATTIASIKSTDYSGAYEHGGMIPAGRFGLVGEAGAELVQGPAVVHSARTTAGMLGGASGSSGSSVVVQVVNNTGAPVREERTKSGDTEMVRIIVGEATRQVADDIKKGGTAIAGAMEKQYGLSRGKGGRG